MKLVNKISKYLATFNINIDRTGKCLKHTYNFTVKWNLFGIKTNANDFNVLCVYFEFLYAKKYFGTKFNSSAAFRNFKNTIASHKNVHQTNH